MCSAIELNAVTLLAVIPGENQSSFSHDTPRYGEMAYKQYQHQ